MFNWEDLRNLAAVARTGSLSAAARLLDVEHATVARWVASLESDLGLRLIDRRGHKLILTPDGVRIAEIAVRVRSEAQAAEQLAVVSRSALSGTITISLPQALAMARLAAPLARLQAKHPAMTLQLLGETRVNAPEPPGADLTIRLARPTAKDLTTIRVGTVVFRFYASPEYLANTLPEAWTFIAYEKGMEEAAQTRRLLDFAGGRPIRIHASSPELQQMAARAGGGIAILPDYLAANDPELVVINESTPPVTRDVWVAVRNEHNIAAMRSVIECIKTAMQPAE